MAACWCRRRSPGTRRRSRSSCSPRPLSPTRPRTPPRSRAAPAVSRTSPAILSPPTSAGRSRPRPPRLPARLSIWAGGGTPATLNEYDGQELELGRQVPLVAGRIHLGDPLLQGQPRHGHAHRQPVDLRRRRCSRRHRSSARRASGWQEVTSARRPWRSPPTRRTSPRTTRRRATTSTTTGYFTAAVTNGPLTALADGTDGPNGLYRYGATGFPTLSCNSSNYWVDVVFSVEPAGAGHDRPDRAVHDAGERCGRRPRRRHRQRAVQRAARAEHGDRRHRLPP